MKMWQYFNQLKHYFGISEYPISAMIVLEIWGDVSEMLKKTSALHTCNYSL